MFDKINLHVCRLNTIWSSLEPHHQELVSFNSPICSGLWMFFPDEDKLYSHLSNKREVTLTDFEKKIHPPQTFPPSTFIDFLDFFHPPLLVYYCSELCTTVVCILIQMKSFPRF